MVNRMPEPIMVYSGLMRLQIERLNSVAQNVSNVNSAGYLQETSRLDPQQFISLLRGDAHAGEQNISHSILLGGLKVTGAKSDLALASDHWFVLSHAGQEFVTRNGNFSLSADGELKLGEYFVQGESGAIKGIVGDFKVNSDGTISLNDTIVDRLKLVKLSSSTALTSVGNGVYTSGTGLLEGEGTKVVQGALTNSNVDSQMDMTKMMEITRQIESIQRAMSAYNDMLDVGVNQLGK
jgi:flagellar basal-body rod protein FlgF